MAPIHRPTFTFRFCVTSFPKLGSSKPTWIHCSNRASFRGFDPFTGRKGASGQSKMVKTAAFRSDSSDVVGGDDEGIRAFEQGAFISSSSSSNYSESMADGLESTLNRLVRDLAPIVS